MSKTIDNRRKDARDTFNARPLPESFGLRS